MKESPRIAYLSMEIGLESAMPTYAGGLGVLAGDTLRSFADLGLRAVGVSLLHRRGYFRQRLDAKGRQTNHPADWPVGSFLEPLRRRVSVPIEGRTVFVRAWRYSIRGVDGTLVPVYFLDTDLRQNSPEDRKLTAELYGGDLRQRLAQETILGIGGVRVLRALGHRVDRFHLNEGHAALAVPELLREAASRPPPRGPRRQVLLDGVRARCVFTTHTPVADGHDRFPAHLARQVLGTEHRGWLDALGQSRRLDMTELALRGAGYVNAVALRHGEVTRRMFPDRSIHSVTNGIHPATWAAPSFQELFDRRLVGWRRDAFRLRHAATIPLREIEWAHRAAKRELLDAVRRRSGVRLDSQALTLGFARRATAYKRAALVFHDLERLTQIARRRGPLQLVFAGKAHPRDAAGQRIIASIHRAAERLAGRIPVVYLAEYDMELGRLLVAGSDVWLNTPTPPQEASGTSGMKAALNGVPSLSVIDGWWVEGCVEGCTGWAVGDDPGPAPGRRSHRRLAEALYAKLEDEVLTCFHGERTRFLDIMRSTIAINGSYFHTQRMALEYLTDAYSRPDEG